MHFSRREPTATAAVMAKQKPRQPSVIQSVIHSVSQPVAATFGCALTYRWWISQPKMLRPTQNSCMCICKHSHAAAPTPAAALFAEEIQKPTEIQISNEKLKIKVKAKSQAKLAYKLWNCRRAVIKEHFKLAKAQTQIHA